MQGLHLKVIGGRKDCHKQFLQQMIVGTVIFRIRHRKPSVAFLNQIFYTENRPAHLHTCTSAHLHTACYCLSYVVRV